MTMNGGGGAEHRRTRFEEESEFWSQVSNAGEFDIEHLMETKPSSCLLFTSRNKDNYPKDVFLYAKMGIHRYNMIQGTNLHLSYITKFNYRPKVVYIAYYITLVAKDPAGDSLVTFQTRVVVQGFEIKQLSCSIARPKPGPQENHSLQRQPMDPKPEPLEEFYNGKLPEWPSSEMDFYDKKRFYLVRRSELRKYGWIRLYTELAFLNANRKLKNPNLSNLKIVKVAVETKEIVEPPCERLKARNANFYIKYKYYPNKGRDPKVHRHNAPRDRIAIVRRTMDKNAGYFNLQFEGRLAKTFLKRGEVISRP